MNVSASHSPYVKLRLVPYSKELSREPSSSYSTEQHNSPSGRGNVVKKQLKLNKNRMEKKVHKKSEAKVLKVY